MNIEVAVGRNNMTPRDSTYKFPSDSTLEHSLDRYVPAEYIIHENRRGKNSARFKCTLIFIMWWTRVFCRGSSDCEFLCSCVFVTSDGDMECLSEYVVVCWGDNAWQLGHLLLLSHFRSSVFTSQHVLIVVVLDHDLNHVATSKPSSSTIPDSTFCYCLCGKGEGCLQCDVTSA
ncbi:hypothetical protein NC652_039280 [Populus alba x Populus x berolinensis]|nr:hypothetical protein NC652_039280 [Populus alba x Populus x berolinensis]